MHRRKTDGCIAGICFFCVAANAADAGLLVVVMCFYKCLFYAIRK